jgi:glutamate synthase (NADPH/NADH) small chain
MSPPKSAWRSSGSTCPSAGRRAQPGLQRGQPRLRREALAKLEADRCLQCKDGKCIDGCPVGIDIPRFLDTSPRATWAAAELLLGDNALPGITGRVCPQEEQCEQVCIRGKKGEPVAVGHLERYVADWARENLDTKDAARRIPPASRSPSSAPARGLTAAGELAKQGTRSRSSRPCTARRRAGLRHPRVPPAQGDRRRRSTASSEMGVEDRLQRGRRPTFTIDELLEEEGFDAVFIANGAGLPIFMNIPGENLKGVYSANEYLTRVNLMGPTASPS